MEMYTGNISIRFRHPTENLEFISSLLGLTCFRNWTVGSPQQTPTGEPLKGKYNDSYWVSRLEFPSEEGFIEQLMYIIDLLVKEKETLYDLKTTGGSIEIYLQLSGSINNGDTINSSLLKIMGDLGVDLLIEVFVGV